jgi:CBS domain-containing protein
VNSLAAWAREGFLSEHIVRPGTTDGDIAFAGFDDTTLLDLISRGLKRGAEVKQGDFEPSHRIAIYEEQPDGRMKVVDIVSQSDCLRVLLTEKDHLGAWAAKTSVDDAFGRKPVLCVPSTLPAIGAFALMQNTDISGCGVIDAAGKLVGHLTVTGDLRCLTSAADFELLRLPALEFAKLRLGGDPEAPASPGGEKVQCASPVVTAQLSDSVLHLMRALVDGKAHRAYILEQGAPVGVVTLTDVLRLLAIDPDDSKQSGMLTW